jgi:hypothetical protein
MDARKLSNWIYVAIVTTMILCNVALLNQSLDLKTEGQRTMLQWPFVLFLSVWGAAGVFLARKIGFPEMWDPRVPSPRKWILPLILGAITGAGSIVFDLIRPISEVYGLKSIHHPLPEGIVVYVYAALISEILFHLLPIPLMMFLFSKLLLRQKYPNAVFWIVAAFASLWESRPYVMQPEQWNWIETGRHSVSYIANLFEIWLFRSFGFLASLEQRLVSYSFWHILWPAITGR